MTPKTSSPIGMIAGTGVAEHFDLSKRLKVSTEFGDVTAYCSADQSYYVLPRHGPEHEVPPHMLNHKANIASLHKLGVRRIIATSAVGSMRRSLRIGQLGLVEQFLDFTRGREGTFFDSVVRHTDMTNPYSSEMNRTIEKAAERLEIRITPGLVYVCVEGPRFETAAEIRMFRRLGGDVVGMTGVPEVVLANELGMEYSMILVVTNRAAGLQGKVKHEEVVRQMKKNGPRVRDLMLSAAQTSWLRKVIP
jgi:5'-methylthioinosine phosphorylase